VFYPAPSEECEPSTGGSGAIRPLPRDGGAKEYHGDPTVGPCPKVWIRNKKWKKYCQKWHAGVVQMLGNPEGDKLYRTAVDAVA